jgi:hypothetical protein
MTKTELVWLAWSMTWIGGCLFGMAFEDKLLERKNRKIQTDKSCNCGPEPFPMPKIETDNASSDPG